MYRLSLYTLSLFLSALLNTLKKILFTLVWEPLKLLIHAILVSITLPWGQFSLGEITLAWIGNEFPPQLALVCSGEPVPNLSEGLILVASSSIPKASIFHKTVVILLEYSVDYGARGVILNYEISTNTNANMFTGNPVSSISHDHHVGYGGPVDKSNITVIHDCRDLSNESDFSCMSESVFVTEYDSARRTLSQLSSKARTLIALYRVAAHKARQKFQECKSAAAAYANRAKDSISASIRSAYSSTRRVIFGVSRGRIRLLPLLASSLANRLIIETQSNSSESRRDESNRYCCVNCGVDMMISPRASALLRVANPIPISSICTECAAKETTNRSSSPSPTFPLSTNFTINHDSDEIPTEDESESSPTIRTNIRVLKGYCRWGPCQLDGEIRRNLWKILPLRHDFVFPEKRDGSWWQCLNEEIGLFNFAPKDQDDPNATAGESGQNTTSRSQTASSSPSRLSDAGSSNQMHCSSESHSFFDEFNLTFNEILAAISC